MELDSKNYQRKIFILLGFVCLFLLIVSLKVVSSIFLPITVAILLSFVFNPFLTLLHKKFKFPRGLSIFIIILIIGLTFYFLGIMLFSSLKNLSSVYPKYEDKFLSLYKEISQIFKLSYDSEISLFQNLWNQLGVRNTVQSVALSLSSSFISFFSDLVLVLLIMVFFLLEFSQFRKKITLVIKDKSETSIRNMLSDIVKQISHYLSLKLLISFATGLLVYIGFLIIGVEFSLLWAFLAIALNFIPNIGSILIGVASTAFALIQFWPSPLPVIAVLIYITLVEMTLGNFIEPRLMGTNLGLSPFIILASLSFWSWLWGFMGMIIAVPMMVILKIICENVDGLENVSILMGTDKRETKANKIKKIFSRKAVSTETQTKK